MVECYRFFKRRVGIVLFSGPDHLLINIIEKNSFWKMTNCPYHRLIIESR